MFQSLNRAYKRSDMEGMPFSFAIVLLFQSLNRAYKRSDPTIIEPAYDNDNVSIPQSGLQAFRQFV